MVKVIKNNFSIFVEVPLTGHIMEFFLCIQTIFYHVVGIRDFFPTFDQRSPHSQGYEVYTDMFKRAARWLYLDPHIQLINLQSVFIKVKKGYYYRVLTCSFGSRCICLFMWMVKC